jgi:hypothetical protein
LSLGGLGHRHEGLFEIPDLTNNLGDTDINSSERGETKKTTPKSIKEVPAYIKNGFNELGTGARDFYNRKFGSNKPSKNDRDSGSEVGGSPKNSKRISFAGGEPTTPVTPPDHFNNNQDNNRALKKKYSEQRSSSVGHTNQNFKNGLKVRRNFK